MAEVGNAEVVGCKPGQPVADDDAAEQISDHIIRLPLPLPLAELRSVNCYAILDPAGTTLIDPGWASDESRQALTTGLSTFGTSLDDVTSILVTHSHWDHYTQAYALSSERGTPLLLGREEAHSIRAWAELDGAFPIQADLLDRAGDHDRARELRARPVADTEKGTAYGSPTRYLDGGETIQCGGVALSVIATPGHTRGHLVFEDREARHLFSGDHILPRITPSIAYERSPDPLALAAYLRSLQDIVDRPDTVLLPAHGAVGGTAADRARVLLDHHRSRLDTVADLVDEGRTTGLAIAAGMRWTRHERTLDELAGEHQWTAILEAVAHAEVLVLRGRVTKERGVTADHYLPVAGPRSSSVGVDTVEPPIL